MIDIRGLDKAEVLAALYNSARPKGMGFVHYRSEPMTYEQAKLELGASHGRFDYLHGRVMKVNVNKDDLDEWLYDRDNGEGAAARALAPLLAARGK